MSKTTLLSLAAGALLFGAGCLAETAWAGPGHGHGAEGWRGHGPPPAVRHRGHGRAYDRRGPAHRAPRYEQRHGHRHGHRQGHRRGPVVVFHPPPPPRYLRHRHHRGCGHRVVAQPYYGHAPRVAIGVHVDGFYLGWNGGY